MSGSVCESEEGHWEGGWWPRLSNSFPKLNRFDSRQGISKTW